LSPAWKSHVSTDRDASFALSELLRKLSSDETPQLAFLFVGPAHADQFEIIVEKAAEKLLPTGCRLLSVVGGGVIGNGIELDEPTKPSMSIMLGRIPEGAKFEVFSFNEMNKPPPPPDSEYWRKLSGNDEAESAASYMLFADPWSPMENIIEGLSSLPVPYSDGAVIVGGISVPVAAKPTVAIDDQPMPQGSAVGIAFQGAMGIQACTAQGCRPVGPVYTVTAAGNNCILELDSEPAVTALESLISKSSVEEQRMLGSGLVCGIIASTALQDNDEGQKQQGDYLIRQIAGFVPGKKGIVIGGSLQVGDRFRFHVRDKATAEEDLKLMVNRVQTERMYSETSKKGTVMAALQISCVGRGQGLYGKSNVDVSKILQLVDSNKDANGSSVGCVGGFFANGEIGPVGVAGLSISAGANSGNDGSSGTHLHGFTTVVAMLCDYSTTETATKPGAFDEGSEDSSVDGGRLDAWG